MKKTTILSILLVLIVSVNAQLVVPTLLQADHELTDSNVFLSWWAPSTPVWLHYDNGINATSIGTSNEAIFDVAIRYNPDQLRSFHGMELSEFAFVPAEGTATYVAKVWIGENADSTIYSDTLSNLVFRDWNVVQFNTSITIDSTKTYYFGYHVNTPQGYPAGCDQGPTVNPGQSDLLRFDSVFVSMNAAFNIDFNLNIQVKLKPSNGKVNQAIAIKEQTEYFGELIELSYEQSKQLITLSKEKSSTEPDLYNIYRNQEIIATSEVPNYHDTLTESGVYHYAVSAFYAENESEKSESIELFYDKDRVPVNAVLTQGFINTALYVSETGDTLLSSPSSYGVFKGIVELEFEEKYVAPVIYHCANAIFGNDPFSNAQVEEMWWHIMLKELGFPFAYFNGTMFGGGLPNESLYLHYLPFYERALDTKTPIAMQTEIKRNSPSKYTINLKAQKVGMSNVESFQIITVLTQERIEYTWADDEFSHVRFVATEMIPSTFGTELYFGDESSIEMDIEIPIDPFMPAENFRLVTYIQDTNTLQVYNAEYLKLPIQKNIVFKIENQTNPVIGASVMVNDKIVTTNEFGFANVGVFDNLGVVDYTISNEDYESMSGTFDVAISDTIAIELIKLVGISNNQITKTLIFPNPTNNEVNIVSNKNVQITMYDGSGKLLMSANGFLKNHILDMNTYDAGIYYIQINDGITIENRKLIKN